MTAAAEYQLVGPTTALAEMAFRPDITLPTRTFSFSQFRLFKSCPACYAARYVDRAPRVVKPALVIGSAVHGALSTGRLAQMRGKEWQVDDLLESASEAFQVAMEGRDRDGVAPAEDPLLELDSRHKDWGEVKDRSIALARATVPVVLAAEAAYKVLAVEAQVDMRGVFPFPFAAYCDRLLDDPTWETFGHIGDDKTAGSDTPPDDWVAWQVTTYALPWILAGETVQVGVNQHIKTRVPTVHLWTEPGYTFTPTVEQGRRVLDMIVRAAERITTGVFEPGPAAFGCEYRHSQYPKFGVIVA